MRMDLPRCFCILPLLDVISIDRCRYSFDKQQWIFHMHFPTERMAQTTAFVIPVMKFNSMFYLPRVSGEGVQMISWQ